ncbi:MAG: hypothetical protein ABIN89_29290 [Chitinophagaceae bacterium]
MIGFFSYQQSAFGIVRNRPLSSSRPPRSNPTISQSISQYNKTIVDCQGLALKSYLTPGVILMGLKLEFLFQARLIPESLLHQKLICTPAASPREYWYDFTGASLLIDVNAIRAVGVKLTASVLLILYSAPAASNAL